MPVSFSWLHLSADSKYAETLYHLAGTHYCQLCLFENNGLSRKGIFVEWYLPTQNLYKVMNGEALKI